MGRKSFLDAELHGKSIANMGNESKPVFTEQAIGNTKQETESGPLLLYTD